MIRKKAERKTYDKVNMKPILKCSICNGEQVAGLRIFVPANLRKLL